MLGFQENKFFFPCYAIKDQTIPVCSMRFTEEINQWEERIILKRVNHLWWSVLIRQKVTSFCSDCWFQSLHRVSIVTTLCHGHVRKRRKQIQMVKKTVCLLQVSVIQLRIIYVPHK